MSTVRTRVWVAFASTAFSRVIRTAEQLLLVPLFLSHWGLAQYGEWLALTAVASFASLTNAGLSQAGGSDVIMRIAADDREGAIASLTTAILLTTMIAGACALAALAIWLGVDVRSTFGITHFGPNQTSAVVAIVILTAAAYFYVSPLSSAVGAVAGAGVSNFAMSAVKIFELTSIALALAFHAPAEIIALCMLLAAIAAIATQSVILKIYLPWMRIRLSKFEKSVLRRFLVPSLSYFGLYISTNVIGVQAPRLILFWLSGPTSVTLFAVTATYARTIQILTNTVANVLQVEVSRAFGSGMMDRFRRMTETLCQVSFWSGLAIALVALAGAYWLFPLWTGGRVGVDWPVLIVLCGAALIGSLSDSVTLPLIGINRVSAISAGRLLSMSCALTLAAAVLRITGPVAVATALVFAEFTTMWIGVRSLASISRDDMPLRLIDLFRWPGGWLKQEAVTVIGILKLKLRGG